MAADDIVQNLISRLGQSQSERLPAELRPEFAPVDGRSAAELLAQARELSKHLRFYRGSTTQAAGDWSALFPAGDDEALLARKDGAVPPHLGLFATFLELYGLVQRDLNRLTRRHLQFQLERVLRFEPEPARPDHAHVLVELKKGAAALALGPLDELSAGKDATGVELVYRPVREVVIGPGKVEELRSVFRDAAGVHTAPVANSADGLGAPLDVTEPGFRAFGGPDLPLADIGFAFASPVLRMQEGARSVRALVHLHDFDAAKLEAALSASPFEAYMTGPKGWLGPFSVAATLDDDVLALTWSLPSSEQAVVDYDAATHGLAFAAQGPVVQLLLTEAGQLGYRALEGIAIGGARIRVDVRELRALELDNDDGSLNPKKAFMPFGAQPVAGSRFLVGCEEALSKRLLHLSIALAWKGAPADLYDWYDHYERRTSMSNGVTANLAFQDRTGQLHSTDLDLMLRDEDGRTILTPNAPPVPPERSSIHAQLYALYTSDTFALRKRALKFSLARPLHAAPFRSPRPTPPRPASGVITVTLLQDFLHGDYRKETIEHALKRDGTVLNEPYTPTVQEITLDYEAESALVHLGSDELESFAETDVQFFHVGCFGQRREHGYLRRSLDFLVDKRVTLLPPHAHEGELLIGLSGLAAGDGMSLLLQVVEGSADPELPPADLRWSVLCDNHWRALSANELTLDTTRDLGRSGLVAVTFPASTTTDNTFLPAGRAWLRAVAKDGSAAACRLLGVFANAVAVRFADRGNDPAHLLAALPAAKISRLRQPRASIKTISQPFASSGGAARESEDRLVSRAAERLRHRDRCLGAWDYERAVLQAFPALHRVKCIPHADGNSWLAPGHVLLVVIPDLRNQNGLDPLRPRVDLDTLRRIAEFVARQSGAQVEIKAKNPRYQRVLLDFKVRFRPGFPFNYYRKQLDEALIRALSPWAFDATQSLEFGGRIYRSVLLDFVEKLPYVDFVTDFRLRRVADDGTVQGDQPELHADLPDAILVSAAAHDIVEAPAD